MLPYKTIFKTLTTVSFVAMAFFSCTKNEPNPPIDYSIFPTNIGHTVIYDVDSVVYKEFNPGVKIETKGQIKDVITGKFKDNAGRETQRVERYFRRDSTRDWEIYYVYTTNLNTTNAETMIDDRTVISLSFPPKVNSYWNGNARNDLPAQNFRYKGVDETIMLGTKSYAGTVTVEQINEKTFIKKEYCVEKYAKGYGLVYKQYIKDSSDNIDAGIVGGIEVTLTIHQLVK